MESGLRFQFSISLRFFVRSEREILTFFRDFPAKPLFCFTAPGETNPGVSAPVLVKSAEACQAFVTLFRMFPASSAVERDLDSGCDK